MFQCRASIVQYGKLTHCMHCKQAIECLHSQKIKIHTWIVRGGTFHFGLSVWHEFETR